MVLPPLGGAVCRCRAAGALPRPASTSLHTVHRACLTRGPCAGPGSSPARPAQRLQDRVGVLPLLILPGPSLSLDSQVGSVRWVSNPAVERVHGAAPITGGWKLASPPLSSGCGPRGCCCSALRAHSVRDESVGTPPLPAFRRAPISRVLVGGCHVRHLVSVSSRTRWEGVGFWGFRPPPWRPLRALWMAWPQLQLPRGPREGLPGHWAEPASANSLGPSKREQRGGGAAGLEESRARGVAFS